MTATLPAVFPQRTATSFNHVNLELTTHCNLRCPECSAGVGINRKLQHHPWEYFEQAAQWLYGMDTITVIGGEPTLHPQFGEFVPRFRELFGCRKLILWTNGFLVERYADLIRNTFDIVHASLYNFENAPFIRMPNTARIDFIKLNFNHATMEEPHVPRSRRGSGDICERGIHGPVTYADGKLYGCCVAVGLDGGIGIEPTANWREELLQVPLPCGECFLSPE